MQARGLQLGVNVRVKPRGMLVFLSGRMTCHSTQAHVELEGFCGYLVYNESLLTGAFSALWTNMFR